MPHNNKKRLLTEDEKKLLPQEVWDVFDKFTGEGYEIYLVGGGVRNILEKEAARDCDFTTNATPDIIQSFFKDSYYDNPYGTVGIPLETDKGEEVYEITPYRTEEGYSDKRRPDNVSFGTSLEEDLKRRDFTFNAIVVGPKFENNKWDNKTLELIDLFGGRKDFKNKMVRGVGDPDERFSEDALRMMRAIRFASQLGFKIENETFKAIQDNAELIKKISAERIRDELLKILASDYPYEGYMFLHNSSLAEIILPEVEACFGVEQKSPDRHHIYDVGTHSVLSLKHVPTNDPIVRLATLLHDIGKPPTRKVQKNGVVTFYNHELVSTDMAYKIAKRIKLSKKQTIRLTKLVRWHQFTLDENQTDKALRRFIRHVGKENLDDMLALRVGDRLGSGSKRTSWRFEEFKKRLEEVQKQPFSIADLKVNGYDVMEILGTGPGPKVGQVLEEVFEQVEEGNLPNKRKELLGKIKEVGKKLKN